MAPSSGPPASGGPAIQQPSESQPEIAGEAEAAEAYAQVPMSFERNVGQTDRRVKYLARGRGYTMYLTRSEAVLTLSRARADGSSENVPAPEAGALAAAQRQEAEPPTVLRMKLVCANRRAPVEGLEELPHKSNYFVGDDPSRWHTNVPNYGRVRYEGIYPGVDLVYYGRQTELEYDFVVAPGADTSAIRLEFEGAESINVDERGDLVLKTAAGDVRQHRPVLYQEDGSSRREVEGSYVVQGDREVGFRIGSYDRARPLTIDPVLTYSTLLGAGSPGGDDQSLAIAVDAQGSAYVTGRTNSLNYPTTAGASDVSHNGLFDVFVTKLSASGNALVYSTFLGGGGDELGRGIAVDAGGSAYVTGNTVSSNYPTTAGAFDTSHNGSFDAFVTKLSADGGSLEYSTFVGGGTLDLGVGIAVDAGGSAYVTGNTLSSNYPTTAGAFDTSLGGGVDAFVTKLSAGGNALLYSTLLGGAGDDNGLGVAADPGGSVYVAGSTSSSNYPTTPGAFDTSHNGSLDAFVTKLSASGNALVYSTFLGGGGGETGRSIAVDAGGGAYVTGETLSSDYPATAGAFDTSHNSAFDVFVTKLSAGGGSLEYSTFVGGANNDFGQGIALDAGGGVYVTGSTQSSNYPTTTGAFDTSFDVVSDVFVTKLLVAGCAAPTITAQPSSQKVDSGGSATLNVVAESSDPGALTYQWFQRDAGGAWVAIGGATSSSYTTPALTAAASYQVTVSNGCGSATSDTATVSLKAVPAITWADPADITYGTPLCAAQLNASADVPGTFTYTPAAGTALAAGAGQTLSVAFTPDDSANYSSAEATVEIDVDKAVLTVSADSLSKVLHTENPPLTVSYSGFQYADTAESGLSGAPSLSTTATQNSPAGAYPITVTAGTLSAANYSFAFVPGTLSVLYAPSTTLCLGEPSRTILQPINADGSSVFRKNSTVPAKFRVCDTDGVSIGTPGVVTRFLLVSRTSGTSSEAVNEPVLSTTPDTAFRWDPAAQQWIYNISTRNLAAGYTYNYEITLDDGTRITFSFGLR